MLKQINTGDQNLQLIQGNIDTELTKLQASPMFPGNVLTNITLISAQDNLIQHGLGRPAKYFIVIMKQVNSDVWSPTSSTLSNKNSDFTYINLRCSTTCIVSVWVN